MILKEFWSRGRELNSRPADYESAALPLSYLGFSTTYGKRPRHFGSFLRCSKPFLSPHEAARCHNVVALEQTHRAMSCDLHGCSLTHTRVRQVPNRGATQIVRSETLVLIPLRTPLLSNSNFNTALNPLTLEILHVEYRTARLLDEDTFLGLIQGRDRLCELLEPAVRRSTATLIRGMSSIRK